MLLNILLVILVVDCIALTGVILLQRSEGGALGMGGGPSGMFTARGAGDLLTRTTAILTVIFFSLSLIITLLAGHNRAGGGLTDHLKVNPLDLNALTNQQKGAAPASSSAPGAPPLPNAAPPLPNAVSPATQAPGAPRPGAVRAPARGPAPLPGIALPTLPSSVSLPRTNLNGPAQAPASQSPAAPGQ